MSLVEESKYVILKIGKIRVVYMKRNIAKFKEGGLISWMHISFLLLFVCITGYSMVDTKTVWWLKLSLVMVLLILLYIRHFVAWAKSHKLYKYISPFVEVLLILPLSLMTQEGLSLWFVMIVVIDVILDYDFRYSIVFSVIGYLAYITFLILKVIPIPIFQVVALFVVGALQYTIIMSVGFFAKKYYVLNIQNKELMAKQKVQMLELENMAILKERNRIAGEIHDSVGHQLTTALVQMEAVSMLIDGDLDQAKRRLDIVRDQVRMGLNELRNSIRELKDESYEDYNEVLQNFAQRVTATTGVTVDTEFRRTDTIPMNIRKIIFYMCMESITNAIRHGRCKTIWWNIEMCDENILVSIENDGIIPDKINPGFGLSRMKSKLEEIHGTLSNGVGDNGFVITANIDLHQRERAINE